MTALALASAKPALDQFFTPLPLAEAIVSKIEADGWWRGGIILEPSAGGGSFVEAAMALQPQGIVANEIDPDLCKALDTNTRAGVVCGDFLDMKIGAHGGPFELVLGNPPFNNAEKHVRHAMYQRARFGACVFLLRLAFLESRERRQFWREFPASKIYVLSERPSFVGGKTDSAAYGVFVWANWHTGPTTIEAMSWK